MISREFRKYAVPAAFAAVFFALCIRILNFHQLYSPDSAEFSILADAIVNGKFYRDISQPLSPHHTKYPFGYPLLLAPAALLADNAPLFVLACKAMTILLGALTLVGVYFFFQSLLAPYPYALPVLMLFSLLNPASLLFSSNVMSEIPQSCFSIWSLILIRFLVEKLTWSDLRQMALQAGGAGRGWAAFGFAWVVLNMAIAVAATYYIRGNGIVLLPAAVVFILLRNSPDPFRFRAAQAGLLAALVALLVAPWVLRDIRLSKTGQVSGENYVSQILTPFENPFQGKLTPSLIFKRVGTNLKYYSRVAAAHVLPLVDQSHSGLHDTLSLPRIRFLPQLLAAMRWLIVFGILLGVALHARRWRVDLTVPYVACFLGLLLVFTYRQHRYLLPLVPFSYYFLIVAAYGAVGAAGRFLRGFFLPAARLAVPAFGAFTLVVNLTYYKSMHDGATSSGESPDIINGAFLRAAAKQEDTVLAYPYLFIFSKRICIPLDPKSMDVDDFERVLHAYGAHYILAEKWIEGISDYDLLMRSSLFFQYRRVHSTYSSSIYRVDAKKDAAKWAVIQGEEQADYPALISKYEELSGEIPDLTFSALLGYLYYKNDEFKNAIHCFEHVVALNPDDHMARFNLGTAYLGNGNYEKALAQFESVRGTEFGYTIQGVLNKNVQIATLKRGLKLDPNAPGNEAVHLDVARMWYDRGVYRKALQELKAAIALNPDFLEAHSLLAAVYEDMRDFKRAADAYREILKRRPDDEYSRLKLKQLRAKR